MKKFLRNKNEANRDNSDEGWNESTPRQARYRKWHQTKRIYEPFQSESESEVFIDPIKTHIKQRSYKATHSVMYKEVIQIQSNTQRDI